MPSGIIVNNSKKKLSSLTRLEAEKESQKRMHQEMEILEAVGGETSDLKSKSDVRRYFNEQEQIEVETRDEAYQILMGLRKDLIQYNGFLVTAFQRFASQEAIPKKFNIYSKATKKGVVVGITGTRYQSAFASCGIPPYDYHACKIMAVKLGNTVAKLMGYTRQTEHGIILPDEEDLKEYRGTH